MSTNLTIKKGDILTSTEEYIVQQCCCTAIKAKGLSEAIATKWPGTNPYELRKKYKTTWATLETRSKPGTISVFDTTRKVIAMFAQYCQGKPNTCKDPLNIEINDNAENRLNWFKECLEEIAKLSPTSVAIPYKIGCRLAGGNWTKYYKAIQEWSLKYPTLQITIYSLA
jgi:O-acetyl-ADP-ribose deacetylase (regulator of RNase III)